jgi:Flp pilus assembly protein TadD
VEVNPPNVMEHRDLGIVYADEGRNGDALREFKSAEALQPGDVNVHWRLGRLYRAMGKTAEAKAEFDKAGSLNKAEDQRLLKVMSALPAGDRKPQEPEQERQP